MLKICPRCQQRYIVDDNTEDFIHDCNSGNDVLDEEDIVVIGKWTDYTGEGNDKNIMLRGSENKLFGTRADIEGEDLDPNTVRGLSSSTHRTRQHLEFIDLKDDYKK